MATEREYYCTIDPESGRPRQFFEATVHGKGIPDDAVKISEAAWRECIDNPCRRRFDESGRLVECEMPESPIPETPIDEAARERAANDPMTAGLLKTVADATGAKLEDLEDAYVANVVEKAGV